MLHMSEDRGSMCSQNSLRGSMLVLDYRQGDREIGFAGWM